MNKIPNHQRRLFIAIGVLLWVAVFHLPSPLQAYPWRRAWVKQNMQNNCGQNANWIMVNGVKIGVGCTPYKDSCANGGFPDALLLSVPNPFVKGTSLTGCAWQKCDTPSNTSRKIGMGCYGCVAVGGASSWWKDAAFVCWGAPFGGASCTSPVKFWGVPADDPALGTNGVGSGVIQYAGLQWAIWPYGEEVQMDDPRLASLPWAVVTSSPVVVPPGGFWEVPEGLLPPDLSPNHSLLLRGVVGWVEMPSLEAAIFVQLSPEPVYQGVPVPFSPQHSLGNFNPTTNVVFNTDPDTGGSPYGAGRTINIYTNYSFDGTNRGVKVRVFDFNNVMIAPNIHVTAQGSGPLIITSGGEIQHQGVLDVSGAHGDAAGTNYGGGGGAGGGAVALFANGYARIMPGALIRAVGGNGGFTGTFGSGMGGISWVGAGAGGNGSWKNGDGGNGGAGAALGQLLYVGAGGGGGGGGCYNGQGGQAGAGTAGVFGTAASAGTSGRTGAQCRQAASGGWGGAGGSTMFATPGQGGMGGINNVDNTKGQTGKTGVGGGGWWGSAGGGGGGGGAAISGNGGNGGAGFCGGGGGGGGGGADACANATCAGCNVRGTPGGGGSGGGGGLAIAAGFPGPWYGAMGMEGCCGNGGAGGGGTCAIGSSLGQVVIEGGIALTGGDSDGNPGAEGGMGVLLICATNVTITGSIQAIQAQTPGVSQGDFVLFGGGGGGGGAGGGAIGGGETGCFDDFESYAVGFNLHGQGDWEGWANIPAAGAVVSTDRAFSPTRSIHITGGSDLVRRVSCATNGQWVGSVMQYIPSSSTGAPYVVWLNKYRPPYADADLNWSVQMQFNLATGQVISEHLGGGTLPLVKDQWVEVRCVINLASNSVSEFYNGQLLSTHAWQNGTGLNEIQALDLFANNAGPVYYDNFRLTPVTQLAITRTGDGAFVLTWSGGGYLQQATSLPGPWVDISDATSPWDNYLTLTERAFYRVRQGPHPGTGTITGTVMDDNDLPLPGTTVAVKGTQNHTTVGPDGSFTLSNVMAGECYLDLTFPTEFVDPVSGETNRANLMVPLATPVRADRTNTVAVNAQVQLRPNCNSRPWSGIVAGKSPGEGSKVVAGGGTYGGGQATITITPPPPAAPVVVKSADAMVVFGPPAAPGVWTVTVTACGSTATSQVNVKP